MWIHEVSLGWEASRASLALFYKVGQAECVCWLSSNSRPARIRKVIHGKQYHDTVIPGVLFFQCERDEKYSTANKHTRPDRPYELISMTREMLLNREKLHECH